MILLEILQSSPGSLHFTSMGKIQGINAQDFYARLSARHINSQEIAELLHEAEAGLLKSQDEAQ